MKRVGASLDTSFWKHVWMLHLAPYLFDYFEIFYCTEVYREIHSPYPAFPTVVHPRIKLFDVLAEANLLRRQDPTSYDATLYGPGEAQALALAAERGYVLLIDDYRSLRYAQKQGVPIISSPDFVVKLCVDGVLTCRMGRDRIERSRAEVSPLLLENALARIEVIEMKRGW